jgi:hypothetical protein
MLSIDRLRRLTEITLMCDLLSRAMYIRRLDLHFVAPFFTYVAFSSCRLYRAAIAFGKYDEQR